MYRRRLAWQHERWHLAGTAKKPAVLGGLHKRKVTQALLKQTLNPERGIRLPVISLGVTCRFLGSGLWQVLSGGNWRPAPTIARPHPACKSLSSYAGSQRDNVWMVMRVQSLHTQGRQA